MFFIYFIYFLIFDLLPDDEAIIFLCCYMIFLYTITYIYKNIFISINFRSNRINFAEYVLKNYRNILLYTQTFNKNYKSNLFWRPLFKKISYFGFYRNSINNINKK